MDVLIAAVAVLFIAYPFILRRQLAGIRAKVVARDGDVGRFDAFMNHRLITVFTWLMPILGVLLLVVAFTGG